MKLTRSRLDSLRAIHGHKMVASLSRSILLWLAETEAQIEKLRYGNPRWFAKRIAMLREFRLQWGPTPPPRSCQLPDVPETYRITKISHWYKDHLRRTEDMLSDAVCQESVGFKSSQSLDDTIVAFNAHIAPIAKLYRFQLQMALADDDIVLRGDAGKAYSVLLYLCRESRTPEIDWLLDTVMWFQISRIPFDWKKAWNKLRHTKRGRWWRKQRDNQMRTKPEAPSVPQLENSDARTQDPRRLLRAR